MSDTNNRPGTHVIRFLDIMFKVSDCGHEQLHLTLKSSKTDQRLKSVTLIIRRQVDKLICPKGLYKPHSFKIGGATEAKRLGFDDDTIMQCHRTHTKNTFVLIFK
jgi:hypothetical protein